MRRKRALYIRYLAVMLQLVLELCNTLDDDFAFFLCLDVRRRGDATMHVVDNTRLGRMSAVQSSG